MQLCAAGMLLILALGSFLNKCVERYVCPNTICLIVPLLVTLWICLFSTILMNDLQCKDTGVSHRFQIATLGLNLVY